MQEKNKYQLDHTIEPLVFKLIKSHKNKKVKEYFEENPIDIHLKGWMDHTPLHVACDYGNLDIVMYLIKKDADVNAQREGVYATPLCWADDVEIAKYLLDNGATINDLELFNATRKDNIQIVDLLLSRGAKINTNKPEYLACISKEAIEIYLKHNIGITGTDDNKRNLLHNLAWLDLPEILDFALNKGVPWEKDTGRLNPYMFAKYGKRDKVVSYILKKYPELVSNQINTLNPKKLDYEKISFLLKNPKKTSSYLALTRNGKLIHYEIDDKGSLIVSKAIEIDIPLIRNFTINSFNHIILPTGENKLLKLDASTFKLIESITFKGDLFDQIIYLPKKELYIGSSDTWKITTLNKDFDIINEIDAEDGTCFPTINKKEDLITFWSYDQETYYNLYRIDNDHQLHFIHTFFDESESNFVRSLSKSFSFIGDKFLVAYPNKIELLHLQDDAIIKATEVGIEEYESINDNCCLATVSEYSFLLGKGNKLVLYTISNKIQKLKELRLDLNNEIFQIYFDNEEMRAIIITNSEIRAVSLKTFYN